MYVQTQGIQTRYIVVDFGLYGHPETRSSKQKSLK